MNEQTPLVPLEFPLHGSRLIEASAGTGKTYTIAALYVRLVLGHGGDKGYGLPLLPPQILVVTFTDAATRELRDRIRARLTEAAAYFRGEFTDNDPFLGNLRADYPEDQWRGCARRLEIAAEWMDEAAVSTIHSWCNRMLREHAFDSGSLFSQGLETDQRDLLAEVARDYWRTFFYSLQPSHLGTLPAHWTSPEALLRDVRGMLEMAADPSPDQDAVTIIDTALEQCALELQRLKAPWTTWADELESMLEQAATAKAFPGNKLNAANRAKWIAALRQWCADPEVMWPALTPAAFSRLTPEGLAEIWKEGMEPPAHSCLQALAELPAQLKRLPAPGPLLQRHAAGWMRQRFQLEQQRRAQLGFDDLLTRLDEALQGRNGERLAEVIRSQFPVALIDEFQDTDPVQYRIFDQVYRVADNRCAQGLFMIGDPKQAIYAFRGADIYTYLKARKATTGRHYTLARNFRSTQGMVKAVNRIFGRAEARNIGAGAFLFRDGDHNPVPFLNVDANGLAEQLLIRGQPQPSLVCWHTGTGETISKTRYIQDMAGGCACEMVRLLNLGQSGQAGFSTGDGGFRRLRPADMAVLVRDGKEAAAIRNALTRRGVRSVYLSDKESVYGSLEAQDLLLWLKACAEPEVDRHLRASLATATIGLDWQALERLNQDENHWEYRVLQFREYRAVWRAQGVLPMLRRLMLDFQVQAKLMGRPDGERAVTNLLHLSELLQQAAVELDGEQALIRFLSERLDPEGQGTEEQVVRLESDEALVKVVTIHKAKGMEYPLVFLPFICTFREVDGKRPPVRYHNAEGRLIVDPAPDVHAVAKADQERVAEDLRLIYVALTRACHATWLGFAAFSVGGKQSKLDRSAMGYLLACGAPIESAALAGHLAELGEGCEALQVTELPSIGPDMFVPGHHDEVLGHARTPGRSARENWWIASYSALVTHREPGAALPVETDKITQAPDTAVEAIYSEAQDEPTTTGRAWHLPEGEINLHDFPRGPDPGTFLHGLLEWAAREGFQRIAEDKELLADTVARRCNRRGWDHWINPLTGWMQAFLAMPLHLPGGESVVLKELQAYQPELEFWFETHHVNALALDNHVCAQVLDGRPRAAVESQWLNGMLKGFIDLVFEHHGRFYVVDYKSNWLGGDSSAYTPEALRDAVLDQRYDLQYVLYTLAMHRLLKARLPDYDYDRHMGGAVYLFLRGTGAPSQGLHHDRPPGELIHALDAMISHHRDLVEEGG